MSFRLSRKPESEPSERFETYRGIRLQPMSGPSRFTREQIEKAVEKAIAKHAHEFAPGK